MAYLFALGAALTIWEIAVGLNSGQISGVGRIYATARRDTQPVYFWLIFGFDGFMLAVFICLFARELHP